MLSSTLPLMADRSPLRRMPGVAGWWSAMNAVTSGSNIASVRDASAFVRNMTVSFNSPTLTGSTLGGLPVVNLTQSPAQYLETPTYSAEAFFGPNRNTITAFCLWQWGTGTISFRSPYDGSNSNRLDRSGSNNSLTAVFSGTSYPTPNHTVTNAWQMPIIRFDGATGRYDAWVGTQSGLAKTATQTNFTGLSMASSNNYKMRIGNEAANASGLFAEWAILNRAISDFDVFAIYVDVMHRWRLL